jgi:hypothetical protein
MLTKPSSRSSAWICLVAALVLSMAACSGELGVGPDNDAASGGDGGKSDLNLKYDGVIGDACAGTTATVELRPLDMLIALDTSFSMDFLQKWISVKKAIAAFTKDTTFDGTGVGIEYFPERARCAVAEYNDIDVPVANLPEVGETIRESLAAQGLIRGTPMVPMMEGVMPYAKAWAKDHSHRKLVLVLATDGIPDESCLSPGTGGTLSNTLENVVKLAEQGREGEPSVSTFVIGVGRELTKLNKIAQAGGTDKALLVDSTKDIEGAFLAALTEIRRRSIFCEFAIPDQEGLDTNQVNVQFTYQGATTTFRRVDNREACSVQPKAAWFYDNPDDPKQIKLCDETCNRVQASLGGEIDIQFGCSTIIF